ncbi:uncharacterized protein LOC103037604 [Astyanax mexicanus]|uniref:Cell number regulator 5-like n=2 Tax=Astyanax mexicanus TaxID=7994 RepID=A0A8B9KWD7_ASTMX|nr:uncharacterized protein LOC103037604 [Astyanax mexicanus]KAG9274504.1 cell number regulator 5-like [Astyanax mexicanus]
MSVYANHYDLQSKFLICIQIAHNRGIISLNTRIQYRHSEAHLQLEVHCLEFKTLKLAQHTTMAVLASNVVFQQPQPMSVVAVKSEQWSTGICDCFDDCYVCCFASFCFPVFACSTASDFGECACLPMLDICCLTTQCVGLGIYTPPISISLRSSVRHRYGIQGDLASDCLYATFCNICSWCQMSREIRRRRTVFTLISTQPAVIAPAPVAMAVASQSTVVSQSTVSTTLTG